MAVSVEPPSQPIRISIKRKSETGQAQILAALLFLLLIPTGVIIAQNATNSSLNFTLEGNLINSSNTSIQISINENETENTIYSILEGVENQSVDTFPPENETLKNETVNITDEFFTGSFNQTNQTQENQILASDTFSGDTASNQTLFNETGNETPQNLTENITKATEPKETQADNETLQEEPQAIPETTESKLSVELNLPDKILRGEEFFIEVVVSNSGGKEALDLTYNWSLPGFELLTKKELCQTIPANSVCTFSVRVLVPLSTETGLKDIGLEVTYV